MLEGSEQLPSALQARISAFVRAFGLHRPEETPCGAPVPTSEAHAISILATSGSMTQRELGAHLRLTKSTVSRLVDQLEQKGLVRRRVGEGDARSRLLELTPQGHGMASELSALRAVRFARLLERIPDADRAGVLEALDKLIEAAHDTD